MLHLQWTKETKDLKLSGLGKEKGTIGDRDTTHQSRGQIWIHKKSTTKKMLGTANFPPKWSAFWLFNFKVADVFLWRRGEEEKVVSVVDICCLAPAAWPLLITGLYKLLMAGAGCWSDPLPGLPDPSPHSPLLGAPQQHGCIHSF